MADVICTNGTCSEYLIRKNNDDKVAIGLCGACGSQCEDDTGQGVDPADRPNPAEPPFLADPNA